VYRIELSNLALLLHKLPHEIEAAPARKINDLIEVKKAKDLHDTEQARKAAKR
jgi:hypothetical protein